MLFFNEWSGGIFKSYATQWDLNSNHILGQIQPIGSFMAIKYPRERGLGTASKLCNCKVLPDIVIYCLFCTWRVGHLDCPRVLAQNGQTHGLKY